MSYPGATAPAELAGHAGQYNRPNKFGKIVNDMNTIRDTLTRILLMAFGHLIEAFERHKLKYSRKNCLFCRLNIFCDFYILYLYFFIFYTSRISTQHSDSGLGSIIILYHKQLLMIDEAYSLTRSIHLFFFF